MRVEQLEAWVLSIVDQVASGHRVEDSRVELKAKWPEPQSAARRIAGHANASGGETVLWIIGLDEQKGVVPVEAVEMATWRSQIDAEFDGLGPSCMDLVIPTARGLVTALLFDSSAVLMWLGTPFVESRAVAPFRSRFRGVRVPQLDQPAVRTSSGS